MIKVRLQFEWDDFIDHYQMTASGDEVLQKHMRRRTKHKFETYIQTKVLKNFVD